MAKSDTTGRPTFDVFWASYLLHHKHPITRLLHFVGTCIVLGGLAFCAVRATLLPVLPVLIAGYACAFTGHWYVEKNSPLTLKHPILAGLCNMRLFALECVALVRIGGGYDGAVKRALALVPLALVLGCQDDIGSQ